MQPPTPHGTEVTLTATPATGWTFSAWSGACTGSGACVVTMDGNKTVTATFIQNAYTLTVDIVGSGTVAKDPDAATYAHGTEVTLTATPATGWTLLSLDGCLHGQWRLRGDDGRQQECYGHLHPERLRADGGHRWQRHGGEGT